jgi:DNA excision repair protein ERCC-3
MKHYKTPTRNEGSIPFTRSLENQQLTTEGGHEGDKLVDLRDYQLPAVEALVFSERAIVKAPAGSGKTIIGAAAVEKFLCGLWPTYRNPSIAWVANTTDQLAQARAAVEKFPEIERRGTVDYFCYVGVGSLSPYDLVVLDECHHAAAPGFAAKLRYYDGPRWGLSATPERADDLKDDVFRLVGPIVHEVPREALVNAGQLAQAHVVVHRPNEKAEMEQLIRNEAQRAYEARKRRWPFLFRSKQAADEQMGRCVWAEAQTRGIAMNEKRNDRIVELALRHAEDSTLIIVGSKQQRQALSARVLGSEVCYSKLGAKRRRELIAAFGSGALKTLFATSLADEGLDVPRANVLILAAAGRSAAKDLKWPRKAMMWPSRLPLVVRSR